MNNKKNRALHLIIITILSHRHSVSLLPFYLSHEQMNERTNEENAIVNISYVYGRCISMTCHVNSSRQYMHSRNASGSKPYWYRIVQLVRHKFCATFGSQAACQNKPKKYTSLNQAFTSHFLIEVDASVILPCWSSHPLRCCIRRPWSVAKWVDGPTNPLL